MTPQAPDRQRLQRREIPPLPPAEQLRSVPAWLLSLILHVALLVALGVLWSPRPKGTGGPPERPVGVAVVYESASGEEYFLSGSGPAAEASSETTPAAGGLASSLPASNPSAANAEALLAELLPAVGPGAAQAAQAAGSMGLDEGGAALGGDRNVPKVKTSVFGIEGEGTRFLYVFDRSESMLGYGGAPLRSAKSELLTSLQSLGPVHQFQIVFYNDSPLPFGGLASGGPKLLKGDDRSKAAATQFVRDISAIGGTQHLDALRMALNMAPDVIFFLTDADSSPAAKDIDSLQSRAARYGTTIHGIQFGSGPSRNNGGWIRLLSEGTGGQFRYVDVSRL